MGGGHAKAFAACLLALGPATVPVDAVQGGEAGAVAEQDPVLAAFGHLSETDRRALQEALIWTGDYVGVLNASFGPRTRDALGAYARRKGLKPADVLGEGPRGRLLLEAKRSREEVGFASATDKRAGLSLSLPFKLLPKFTATTSGSRYSSPDGSAVVDTVSRAAGEAGLAETFERMSVQTAARKVIYKLLRPDFFVVAGMIGERSFYSRFGAGTVGDLPTLRGFTFSYPKGGDARLDRIALAVAASFDPFPAPGAVSPAPGAKAPGLARTDKAPEPAAGVSNPRRSWANALLVGPDLALTTISPTECFDASLSGKKGIWRQSDPMSGFALLDVAAPQGAPITLASSNGGLEPVFALFRDAVRMEDERPGPLLLAPGNLRPGGTGATGPAPRISAPLQTYAVGSVVVDRTGGLSGIVAPSPVPSTATVAGLLVEAAYPVKDRAAIAAFLAQAGVPTRSAAPATAPIGTLIRLWAPAVVLLSCQRQTPGQPP